MQQLFPLVKVLVIVMKMGPDDNAKVKKCIVVTDCFYHAYDNKCLNFCIVTRPHFQSLGLGRVWRRPGRVQSLCPGIERIYSLFAVLLLLVPNKRGGFGNQEQIFCFSFQAYTELVQGMVNLT